jgi:hypothetical protein
MTVGRPGYFGAKRDERFAEYDAQYGDGNWRLAWVVGSYFFSFEEICLLYEDAYMEHYRKNKALWISLVHMASDVYDDAPSNLASGLDYLKQETGRNHIQDISIRRVVVRIGARFLGEDLIQIRHDRGDQPWSMALSPGKVRFHLPHLFERPHLEGWWDDWSVECLYQTNKVLQIKPSQV